MCQGAETKRSLHKGVTLMWTLVVLHLVAAPTLILVLRTWSMVLTFVTFTCNQSVSDVYDPLLTLCFSSAC